MKIGLVLLCLSGPMLGLGVPMDMYAIANDDGMEVTMDRAAFEALMPELNAIFSQVALSFELRSYNVVSNRDWISIDSESKFLDVLDSCPSTNGVPVYVFREIAGLTMGLTLPDEGCSIEAGAGAGVLAHELGHMCGLDDIYASAGNGGGPEGAEVVSVRDDAAREDWLPMDWGRYPQGTTQGDLIDRMLMNGHCYVNAENGVDITAGDVYGVCLGPVTVTNATTGIGTRPYVKGMAKVGFLQHGNRNPSRMVRCEETMGINSREGE